MLDIMQLIERRYKFNYNGEALVWYCSRFHLFYDEEKKAINLYCNIDRKYLIKNDINPEDKDEWVDYIIGGGDDEFLITTACGVRILLNNGFFIKGIYEFGVNSITNLRLYLIQLSKNKLNTLCIGIYKGFGDMEHWSDTFGFIEYENKIIEKNRQILNKDNLNNRTIKRAKKRLKNAKFFKTEWELDLANSSYTLYIKAIESFVNYGINKYNKKNFELYEIGIIKFDDGDKDYGIFYPRYFSQSAFRVRKLLEREELIKLSSVGGFLRIVTQDCILPNNKIIKQYKQIAEKDFKDYESNTEKDFYLEPLQKGDIVITKSDSGIYTHSIHLISDDIGFVFVDIISDCSDIIAVIRPLNICPEYLCLYLMSEIGQMVMECYDLDDEMPILPPKNNDDYYKDMFKARVLNEKSYNELAQTPKEQALTQIVLEAKNRNEFKVEFIDELVAKGESLGDILEAELRADNIKLHDTQLKDFIENDINELNTCFKNGAYKATLALAGSILEVFLIDWLSEIHGRDYFNETYRPPGKSSAVLVDYIEAIKEIKKPEWMQEADKAHSIREKRNLLHAKLCLKSDEINEKVCREVIEYLKDIIKTRGI